MQLVLPIVACLIGGLAIGLQNPLASLMGQRLGIVQSVFIIHLGGTMVAALALLATPTGALAGWRSVPWYALGAGALGVTLVGAVTYAIPRLGTAATMALVVAVQLGISTVLDHYGVLGVPQHDLDTTRVAGVVLLLAGAWLVLR